MTDYPRCAACRFWNTQPLLGGDEKQKLGACALTVADTGDRPHKSKHGKAIAWPFDKGSFLQTHAEFGCVQHEARP